MATLGETIRQARVAKDLTLRELARRLKKTPSYISDIENDRRTPSEAVLMDLADNLDLDFDDLMALAGRVGSEAQRLIRSDPEVARLFRRISEMNPKERKKYLIDRDKSTKGRKS